MKRNRVIALLLALSAGVAQPETTEVKKYLSHPAPTEQSTLLSLEELFKREPQLVEARVARLDGKGYATPLVVALEKGDLPLAELLLNSKANPNRAVAPGDRPAAHWVFSSAADPDTKLALLQLLLSRGTDPAATDRLGRNLFHAFVENRNWSSEQEIQEAAHRLRQAGVPIDQEDQQGYTPLLSAVLRHEAGAVKALLSAGADPRYVSAGLELDAVELARRQSFTVCHPAQAQEVWNIFQDSISQSDREQTSKKSGDK